MSGPVFQQLSKRFHVHYTSVPPPHPNRKGLAPTLPPESREKLGIKPPKANISGGGRCTIFAKKLPFGTFQLKKVHVKRTFWAIKNKFK